MMCGELPCLPVVSSIICTLRQVVGRLNNPVAISFRIYLALAGKVAMVSTVPEPGRVCDLLL